MSIVWRVLSNNRGIAATEFALIAPVFAMLLIGTLDIAHTLYMQAVLQGTIQKAARDSSLETGTVTATQNTIDGRVRTAVKKLNTALTDADIVVDRRYYKTFSKAAAAQAEPLTNDVNGNNWCDPGDQYTDTNNNGLWNSDGSTSGQGGARDITVYTVTVTYPHMFPLWKMLGTSSINTISAKTVIANQPYGAQSQFSTATTGTC